MNIPRKIYIAGIPVTINKARDFYMQTGQMAEINYLKQQISLDTAEFKQESLEQAYIQNVLRYCLYAMSEHELRANDKFTDSLAHLLHQALTMKEE